MNRVALFGETLASIVKTAALSRMLTPQRIKQVIQLLKRKHPEWGEEFIEKYVPTIAKYAPTTLLDMNILEHVMKKVYMYGGLEPSMLNELADVERKIRGIYGW